ncbi:hypothetical protein B0H13DRAFT_2302227 [Mycena leptocephala]|nr:hypothetical protein B0H13DRAFT_2302227 [Mycena leptocephala]
MPRRPSPDLLHARHPELLPPSRGLPSLLLLPSPCFTLMNTRFSPSLLPLTCPADNDTYFPRTTRRARLGGIGPEVLKVGSGSDKLPRCEPAWHRAGGNDAGRGKKRSAGGRSLCCSPRCSDGLLEWGWTWALARTTCLSFSLGFLPACPSFAGVKRGARSYSLHFSRASPPSPVPGPALLPFLPSLLSVIILLTHLLVVSRTPFSQAARWVCVASLSSLPFLSLSFPFFLPTCKDGIGLDRRPISARLFRSLDVSAYSCTGWGVRRRVRSWSRVRGCLATHRDIGVGGGTGLAAAARILIPNSPPSFLLPSADDSPLPFSLLPRYPRPPR